MQMIIRDSLTVDGLNGKKNDGSLKRIELERVDLSVNKRPSNNCHRISRKSRANHS